MDSRSRSIRLLHEVGGMVRVLGDATNRTAVARACIAYRDSEQEFTCIGEVRGRVSDHVHEGPSFGFDSYFIPDGYEQTFSEMGLEEKMKISHRQRAIEALLAELENRGLV